MDGGEELSETFFATVRPPRHFETILRAAEAFIDKHHAASRPVALVTSGGTTVPLERQMVRFLDNFSAGTRGSISSEWFLRRGFAVIFLHRQYSLRPFARHYRHADELVLDMFEIPKTEGAPLTVKPIFQAGIYNDVKEYHKYRVEDETLLPIHFYTVADYLYLLSHLGRTLAKVGPTVMIYLAAAVSDFYLPETELSDHKIQSEEGTLTLRLEPVPKLIRPLVVEWCPEAFIVSFKLETDPKILLEKARLALKKYRHNVVVANLLIERRTRLTIVRPDQPDSIISIDPTKGGEIEEVLVDRLVSLFNKHCDIEHFKRYKVVN